MFSPMAGSSPLAVGQQYLLGTWDEHEARKKKVTYIAKCM
jgi:hypothetical protein